MSDNTFTISDTPPASKRPPGRPKGSTNKPRTTASAATDAATLRQALASLDSLYEFTTMGLAMFGLTQSATDWMDAAEQLRKTNEDALKASPRLAAAIARSGSVGGATTFIVAHAVAVTGLMRSVQSEVRAKQGAAADAAADIQPPDLTLL